MQMSALKEPQKRHLGLPLPKFLYNKMAELVAEVEESVVDGCSFDLYTGILSWVENREFVTLRNTSCYKLTSQS